MTTFETALRVIPVLAKSLKQYCVDDLLDFALAVAIMNIARTSITQ